MVSMVLEERDGESVGLLGAYLIVGSGVEQRYTFLSFFFFLGREEVYFISSFHFVFEIYNLIFFFFFFF